MRPEQRRVEWGSEDSDDYAGWLQVFEAGDGEASSVTLHLSFLGHREQAREHGDTRALMQRELDAALERLERAAVQGR